MFKLQDIFPYDLVIISAFQVGYFPVLFVNGMCLNMPRSSSLIILGNFVIISYAGNLVYLLVFLAQISMCH